MEYRLEMIYPGSPEKGTIIKPWSEQEDEDEFEFYEHESKEDGNVFLIPKHYVEEDNGKHWAKVRGYFYEILSKDEHGEITSIKRASDELVVSIGGTISTYEGDSGFKVTHIFPNEIGDDYILSNYPEGARYGSRSTYISHPYIVHMK